MSGLHELFNTPWQAFVTSLSSLGIAGFLYIVWKIGTFLIRMTVAASHVVGRITDGEATIKLMATNHLPHLQAEMEKTNALLSQLMKYAEMYVISKANN